MCYKKWDSLIKLIRFRAATLSKRSFIVEDVKCLLRELVNQSMDNLSTLAAATNSELDDSSTQSLYSSSCKDVQQTPSLYERHMASIDGGSTLRSESHSLAVKQILACVWGQLVCLNKDSVCSKYVCISNAAKVPVSVKTVRTKLLALEYFCQFVLRPVCSIRMMSPARLQDRS